MVNTSMVRQLAAAAVAAALTAATASAQFRRPKADLTLLTDADAVRSGTSIRLALDVELPEGLHVQSHEPRDPSLIPTVLTLTPPAGVTIAEVVYPRAEDYRLAGSSQTLAVYGRRFVIGVRLSVPSSAPPGEITVPARLRYQACDASSCFPPASETAQWTVRVVDAGSDVAPKNIEIFRTIPFETSAGDSNGR